MITPKRKQPVNGHLDTYLDNMTATFGADDTSEITEDRRKSQWNIIMWKCNKLGNIWPPNSALSIPLIHIILRSITNSNYPLVYNSLTMRLSME